MLNIYRASAGAGKTHLLTGEYIKLLFRKNYMPENADHETQFNEILAVTFTNKSTAEMKARIIKEMSVLAKDPQKSDYYEKIKEDKACAKLTDKQISEKALRFLNDILNNYSEFAVSTIDSFFQKIVRNFARELNLQGNYEVELDSARILDLAVTNFIEKLDRQKHEQLFKWMMSFSEKKIEEGKGWQVDKDLKDLVKSTLANEAYREKRDKIQEITADKKFLTDYTKMLQEIIGRTKAEITSIGKECLQTLDEAGFQTTDFFNGNKGKFNTFFKAWNKGEIKEPDDALAEWAEDENLWYKKTGNPKKLPTEQTGKIKHLLNKVLTMQAEGVFRNYYSALAIIENIYQLGILADIDNEVTELCNEEGSMMIFNTTEMLNKLINADDAPFIYEKTGTHIHSFMIDEFQDTSKMQWNNFRPLIENSLADGRRNLIVGDVKQSIYRWRGSDWGLLHKGLKNFAGGQSYEDKETLDTNYRSQKEVINFNNKFFKFVAEQLADINNDEDIREIFSDVKQKVDPKKLNDSPGAVEVYFFESKKKSDKEGKKFEEIAMEKLPEAVIKLQDSGFKAKDIAILCRKTDQCKDVADALLKYKNNHPEDTKHVFDIISGEALLLNSRHVIRTIISILQYLYEPDSSITKAVAACNLLQQKGLGEIEAVVEYFNGNKEIEEFQQFSNRPLYDLVEGVISILPNQNKDIAFIQAFRDCVLEFTSSNRSSLNSFLEWWQTYCKKRCINTPEGQNAIRIMTIHKSKGLGMPAVILPFTEGKTEMDLTKTNLIWCEPKVEPFNKCEFIMPIKCKKDLDKTIFAEDFKKEQQKALIDNINTLYVACTRAKEAMIIFTATPLDSMRKDGTGHLERLLESFCKNNPDCTESEKNVFTFGKFGRKQGFEKDEETDVETITHSDDKNEPQREIPHLSLKHDKLIKDIDAIERGNCIHEALSAIIDYNNIDDPINNLYVTGKLSDEYFSCEEMKEELHRLLSQQDVREWFKPGLCILNERTILGENKDGEKIHRPDRVVIDGDRAIVIDYKTGEHRKKHFKQVLDYMTFLSHMGFNNVEGFIWYTNPHEIMRVKQKNQ